MSLLFFLHVPGLKRRVIGMFLLLSLLAGVFHFHFPFPFFDFSLHPYAIIRFYCPSRM